MIDVSDNEKWELVKEILDFSNRTENKYSDTMNFAVMSILQAVRSGTQVKVSPLELVFRRLKTSNKDLLEKLLVFMVSGDSRCGSCGCDKYDHTDDGECRGRTWPRCTKLCKTYVQRPLSL